MKPTLVRLIVYFKGDDVTIVGKRRGARGRTVTQAVQQSTRAELKGVMNSQTFRQAFLIKQTAAEPSSRF